MNYGVTFPLFAKIDVRGNGADPLFSYLSDAAPFAGYELDKEAGKLIKQVVSEHYPDNLEGNGIKWNFTKFLIDKNGNVVSRFAPQTEPKDIEKHILELLK